MRNLAIIPARGGSKRIPRKNIREFLGKPIISYSIRTAIDSRLFDAVIVSTDDQEIASIAIEYGAEVPFMRSAETAGDNATTAAVLIEVLQKYEAMGRQFDNACCIYPTAPLLKKDNIEKAYNLLTEKGYNSVFPVVAFSYPIWRSVKVSEDGKAEMHWPENINARSQDLPGAWHDAGQFYWFNTEKFTNDPRLFSDNSGAIVLDEMEVQDIDNITDWKMAEIKAGLQ